MGAARVNTLTRLTFLSLLRASEHDGVIDLERGTRYAIFNVKLQIQN